MLNMNNFIEIKGSHALSGEETIFSLRNNWNMFRPYLEDTNVVTSLRRCLGIHSFHKWDRVKDAPWTYTSSDYWWTRIDEKIENDIEYRFELKKLFEKTFGTTTDSKDDYLWDKMYQLDAYYEMRNPYYKKYQPKEGEIEWYQWVHGCFFITPFVATLLQATIKDVEGIFILTSETHSVAGFIKDKVVYYADLLIEWKSVEDLRLFMGKVTKITLLAIN